MQLKMKRTILIVMSLALLASCGTQNINRQIVKIENNVVRTKFFNVALPSGWRVATSLTNEVRDSYYPERFTPLQRFIAYDPVIFEKTLEIGIYAKFTPTFDEFIKNIEEVTPGDRINKTDIEIGGIKFRKYACFIGTTKRNPKTYIAQNKDYYIHIVTQDTWVDLEKTIETLVFNDPELWNDSMVSQAESDNGAYTLIGEHLSTFILDCKLPSGWKVKNENQNGLILIKTLDDGQIDAINCFVGIGKTLDDSTKSVTRTMSNPKIEKTKFGNIDFVKISDPTDGTTKSIYFVQKNENVFSFFCSSPTKEPSQDRISILSSMTLK